MAMPRYVALLRGANLKQNLRRTGRLRELRAESPDSVTLSRHLEKVSRP
jgi:hypothetical protein